MKCPPPALSPVFTHVLCRHLNGTVYAGLANGTVVVLDARDPAPSTPRHSVVVGGGAVRNCLDVMEELWVSCEGSLYQMDLTRHTLRVCEATY